MAQAARPGTKPGPRRRKNGAFKVTIGEDTYILRKADLGAEDYFMVRRQTGRTFQSFISDFDVDTFALIVWLARRKAGERKLRWDSVLKEMPTQAEFEELAEDDLIDFDIVEDLDAEPESDPDEEDESADPLPSAGD